MRRREFYWSLYNRDERRQIDDLRTDQVEAIFVALNEGQRKLWMVWKEGFRNWKAFDEFPVLIKELRQSKEVWRPAPPSPPESDADTEADVDGETETDFDEKTTIDVGAGGSALTLDDGNSGEARGKNRYSGHFVVTIEAGGKVYKTRTLNVSMTGFQIETGLPKGLAKYFNVVLSLNGKSIPLLCSAVEGKPGEPIRRVRIEHNDNNDLLRTWLLSNLR